MEKISAVAITEVVAGISNLVIIVEVEKISVAEITEVAAGIDKEDCNKSRFIAVRKTAHKKSPNLRWGFFCYTWSLKR